MNDRFDINAEKRSALVVLLLKAVCENNRPGPRDNRRERTAQQRQAHKTLDLEIPRYRRWIRKTSEIRLISPENCLGGPRKANHSVRREGFEPP